DGGAIIDCAIVGADLEAVDVVGDAGLVNGGGQVCIGACQVSGGAARHGGKLGSGRSVAAKDVLPAKNGDVAHRAVLGLGVAEVEGREEVNVVGQVIAKAAIEIKPAQRADVGDAAAKGAAGIAADAPG